MPNLTRQKKEKYEYENLNHNTYVQASRYGAFCHFDDGGCL